MKRIYIVASAAAFMAIVVSLAAFAAPVPKPDSLSKFMLSYFEELKEMPAPIWLTTGLRIVYEVKSEDYIDATKDTSGYYIYDVVDVKSSYVVSTLSSSYESNGKPKGLMFNSVLVEEPSIGRFYMSPELLMEGTLPSEKYDIFYSTQIEVAAEKHDAMLLGFTSPTREQTVAYDKETGLILFIDLMVLNAEGKQIQGTVVKYLGARLSFPPWFGENLTGLSTGTNLKYKAVYIKAGIGEEETLDLRVTENNGTWAAIDRTSTDSAGVKSTFQIVASSSSGDVYVLWLPIPMLQGFSEGEVLFEEDLTGSMVKALGTEEDAVHGPVRKLVFADNAVHTECSFSLKTGYLVSLHQKPLSDGIPEVIYSLVSVK